MMGWLDDACSGWRAGVAVALAAVIIWYLTQAVFGWISVISPAHSAERGIASVYSSREGKWTASGERMNDNALAAAHRTLPFGTKVLVRHGGRSIVVRINDRGPHVKRRIIDLTPKAARAIDLNGLGNVELSVLN